LSDRRFQILGAHGKTQLLSYTRRCEATISFGFEGLPGAASQC
jgi:hypothetical protein